MAEAQDVALFRGRPVSAARQRLFGQICIATPPVSGATLLAALLSVGMLAAAVFVVEVPQRTPAVGVLMPVGGLLRIVATESGQIAEVAVTEGMSVSEGQLLFRVTSDRNASDKSSVSESRIRSLKAELELSRHAHYREQDLKTRQASELDKQITLTRERIARAAAEVELQSGHVRLLEHRIEYMRTLAATGSIARDNLARARSDVLQAKAIATGLEGAMLQIRQELRSLQAERNQVVEIAELDRLKHDMELERLQRQIGRAEIDAGHSVLAPAHGIVARLSAKEGAMSRPGETLMTLYEGDARLEAWLYLPSHKAGQLRAGQPVQLRLDAYPHEVFGTLTAIVSKVSRIALLASELSVPLPINGPVFEVRASISASAIEALGSTWPLAPGTSFKADVIRRRYRLYQWLLRSVGVEEDSDYVVAGL
jgi:membrane fusion protein